MKTLGSFRIRVERLFDLKTAVVACEHLLDQVAAENIRGPHDVLLQPEERLFEVLQFDDGEVLNATGRVR